MIIRSPLRDTVHNLKIQLIVGRQIHFKSLRSTTTYMHHGNDISIHKQIVETTYIYM